jgi:hypothetical protein
VAVVVTVQRLVLHKQNVFRIFASAARNIGAGLNPYAAHPDQYFDFFRYSPAFAFAFTPYAIVPEWLGLAAWNLTNALALFWAVRRLLPRAQAQLVLLLVVGDIARTMQSCQSNGLVTALMIAAFIAYSGPRVWRGAFAVAAGTAIKLFPLGAAVFALLRRDRRRALGAVAVAIATLAVLPAVFLGPHDLMIQYARWAGQEHAETFKPMSSVMDLLDVWLGYYGPRLPVQLVGFAILLVPVIGRELRDDPVWRLRLLSSLLIFSVLFNYGAERPTMVIATTGVAIWYVTGPRATLHSVLVLLTLALVTADGVGLWPSEVRQWMDEGRVRVIPLLASWIVIQWDLLSPSAVPVAEAGLAPEIA